MDAQAIASEIKRWATIPKQEPEDILLRDIYNQPGISRTRAERIFRGLIGGGILVEYRMIMTGKHSKVMAYRLAEGKTLDDLKEAVKALA